MIAASLVAVALVLRLHGVVLASSEDEDQGSRIGKRAAYSYVSEYKRLPVYNFGLGKRDSSPSGHRMYSFGLGKRDPRFDVDEDDSYDQGKRAAAPSPYSFGLGKREGRLYSFGLGKRSAYYYDDEAADYADANDYRLVAGGKRAAPSPYSFGLGKREGRLYSFGLGKRADLRDDYEERDEERDEDKRAAPSPYSFGLGKKNTKLYSFGLGKRDVSNDSGERHGRSPHYSFGLGKRGAAPSLQAPLTH